MQHITPRPAAPSRRRALALGAGTALAALVAVPSAASAASAVSPAEITRQLRALEEEYAARLGVFAFDPATGATVAYRAEERFPICSVFKALAAAAVLRDLDRDGEFLAKRVHYTQEFVRKAGYAPVTGKPENIEGGLTVEQLCAAAVSESDNAAANLLLSDLGGPTAITRFCRSLGDGTTRLDRWEPELNTAEPWRDTDTTSPGAIGKTFARLVLGRALTPEDRERLTGWLVANTTNTERFRKGLPADWILADKTGGGTQYGVANDVGVVWPPERTPLVLSVLSTKYDPQGPTDNPLVARAAALVADALV
ncbi:class A beta-lactamase [Streptomyces botrytidirepellens]|uniref:Beta-lactamase n=1 Tax=Streptomyces botrytidirepellens TaxID=2486417 RepID=A0A3M8T018_9ACTN|nr:class A beta-lactamase [Streptomyces botrytidirepellens]RNF86839.1 class A beta-lactamase [Streptomyces botrytidirepellens]